MSLFLPFIHFDTHLLLHRPCQCPVILLCCLIWAVWGRSFLWIPWLYVLMRSGTVVSLEELDWQLYLWLAREGIVLLICTNLLCPTPPPLTPSPSTRPQLLCPWFPVSSSYAENQAGFLLTEMLAGLSCGESRGGGRGIDEESECIVAPCPDWQQC